MPALRPSNELQNKSNVRPTNNRFTEAWAEDFNEIGDILTDHADILDSLTGSVSPSPFYGTFDSLATLEAAFPVAEENAYAIIDAGVGSTPQIAVWNDTSQSWEIGGYTGEIVWLNNIGDRPATGQENTLYIVKDAGVIYYWFSGSYALLNGGTGGGVSSDTDNSLTLGSDDKPFFKQRTNAEIKTSYESNANTNAFTDAEKTSLSTALQPNDLDDYLTESESDLKYTPLTRTLTAGNGIQTIGDLSQNRTINLDFDYLDGRYASGFKQREAARVTTMSNISLSGLQTIDGVILVAGDRVLVKNQTNAALNGVYIASSGTWTRASDFDEPSLDEVAQGASIFVEEGTMNAATGWSLSTAAPITIGTTDLIFIQYAGSTSYQGGDKITIAGTEINHDIGSWTAKTALSGATVISNLNVDAYGHLANWTTRNLTASNIGAEPSFSKNTAFNKNFGTIAGTVLQGNWRPSYSDLTGTNPSYIKSESDSRYLRKDVSDTKTGGNLDFNDGLYARFGTNKDATFGYNGSVQLLNLLTSDFSILDNGVNRFNFNRTTGDFTTIGTVTGRGTTPLIAIGSGSSVNNISFIPFYEANGSTRQGYVGFGSSGTSDLYLVNDVSGKSLRLREDGVMSYNGSVTATSFTGNGSGLTSVNADRVDGKHIWTGSQASYNAIGTKDANTLYFIT